MIKLCVFDMDGLLIDSERQVYVKCGLQASEKAGRVVSEKFLTSIMGCGWDEYKGHFLEEYGDDYPFEEYWKYFWPQAQYLIENTAIDLRPGVKEILDYCKENNIKMAVATSSPMKVAEKCLNNSGIFDYFDYVVAGNMVKHSKPDPEIFLTAVNHFGFNLEEVLLFEDGHNGSLACFASGCRYIVVEDLAYLTIEDKQRAVLVLDNIAKAIDYIKEENERASSI